MMFRMFNTSMLAPQASLEAPGAAQLPSALAQGAELTQLPMAMYSMVHENLLCPQLFFSPIRPEARLNGTAGDGVAAGGRAGAGRSAQAEGKPEQFLAFQVSPYYYAYRGCRCTEGRVALRPPPPAHRRPLLLLPKAIPSAASACAPSKPRHLLFLSGF